MLDNNNKTILIVDDEPDNIEILFSLLYKNNYQLLVATNGVICLEILKTNKPTAIIMDWEMPKLNGIETIKQIRLCKTTRNIPIIMATGKMTSSENLKTALSAGANDYIRKPFDEIEIIARVKAMIHLKKENEKVIALEKQILELEVEKINNKLEENQKSLASYTLKLIQSQENVNLILDELKTIYEYTNREEQQKDIQQLISSVKANKISSNWNEFETVFVKVHTTFYDNLNAKFPDLSQNNLKICAFLKLNLTNKEICSITCSEENTIKKAKNRLRKKLGIDVSENIAKFIQNI